MGTKRRESSDKTLRRLCVPISERETLLPCPSCEGKKYNLKEKIDYKKERKQLVKHQI